jgi:16S rRNA U1498 N3-methylase RsmE
MIRCYLPSGRWSEAETELDEDESKHLASVLRAQAGDRIGILDGQGRLGEAEVVVPHKKRTVIRIVTQTAAAPVAPRKILAQALVREQKMDWLIQKAVELGVHEIWPLQTEQAVVRIRPEEAGKKTARWQSIALGACKQSGNPWMPRIAPVRGLAAALADLRGGAGLFRRAAGQRGAVAGLFRAPAAGSLSAGGDVHRAGRGFQRGRSGDACWPRACSRSPSARWCCASRPPRFSFYLRCSMLGCDRKEPDMRELEPQVHPDPREVPRTLSTGCRPWASGLRRCIGRCGIQGLDPRRLSRPAEDPEHRALAGHAGVPASARRFNEAVAQRPDVVVLTISADLPFAQGRFCASVQAPNGKFLSTFRAPEFGMDYGTLIVEHALMGLQARAVIVLDGQNIVKHRQLVSELTHEPDYAAALAALE